MGEKIKARQQLAEICLITALLRSRTSVNLLRRMADNGLNQALRRELRNGAASERATKAQTVGHDSGGDELVGRHLLQQLVVGGCVHQDGIVQLITNLALAPLLNKCQKT